MSAANGIREVAAQAGVSVGTVSNVLNRPERVSSATRERVERAIVELDFVRNEPARQLRAGGGRTLALVVNDIAHPAFSELAYGAGVVADRVGYALFLCNSEGIKENEERYLSLADQRRVQALLITPIGIQQERLAQISGQGIPVVLLDRLAEESELCSVSVDDVSGGDLAASHVIGAGHRRIAHISGVACTADRRSGVLRAFRNNGMLERDLMRVDVEALTVAEGQQAGHQLLSRTPGSTAVLCDSDMVAMGVMQAARAEGMAVPDDIAVVGYDDIELAESLHVPLTTVRSPRTLLGRTAAEVAMDELTRPATHRHQHTLLPPELVVRQSA